MNHDPNHISPDTLTAATPSLPSPIIPPLPQKTDRSARARKHGWLFFALAALCFLLPFMEVSFAQQKAIVIGQLLVTGGALDGINPSTGRYETSKEPPQPTATFALGLSVAALVLALARKPFPSLLGGMAGAGGVIALLALESNLKAAAAGRASLLALSIREGFWLACAFLTAGTVVQLMLWKEARTQAGWKFTRQHGVVFTCLALLVGGYCRGPFLYDRLTNTAPTQPELASALATRLPATFANFNLSNIEAKFDQTSEKAVGKVKLTLALKEPLYASSDFSRSAMQKGDNPQAYEAAIEQSSALPSNLAPNIPSNGVRSIYILAKPVGSPVTIEASIAADKLPRGWTFNDCFFAWANRQSWKIDFSGWPAMPTDFSDLATRAEVLRRGGFVTGEDSTEKMLQTYIENRRTFIAAVANAVVLHNQQLANAEDAKNKQTLERIIIEAIHNDASQKLKPGGTFVVRNVSVVLPAELPTTDMVQAMGATATIEQTVDLYRLAKEQPPQWQEFQPNSLFEKAKAQANGLAVKLTPPNPDSPAVYEFAFPAGSVTVYLKIAAKGQPTSPTIQNIAWLDNDDRFDQSLTSIKDAGNNALVVSALSGNPRISTVENYRQQIQQFIQKVNQAHEKQLQQRYDEYFVSENPNSPTYDKVAAMDDRFFEVFHKSYSEKYDVFWDAIVAVIKTNYGSFKGDKNAGIIATGLTSTDLSWLDQDEKRLRLLITQTEQGVTLDVKLYIYANWPMSRAEVEAQYRGHYLDYQPQFRDMGGGTWFLNENPAVATKLMQTFYDRLDTQLKKGQ